MELLNWINKIMIDRYDSEVKRIKLIKTNREWLQDYLLDSIYSGNEPKVTVTGRLSSIQLNHTGNGSYYLLTLKDVVVRPCRNYVPSIGRIDHLNFSIRKGKKLELNAKRGGNFTFEGRVSRYKTLYREDFGVEYRRVIEYEKPVPKVGHDIVKITNPQPQPMRQISTNQSRKPGPEAPALFRPVALPQPQPQPIELNRPKPWTPDPVAHPYGHGTRKHLYCLHRQAINRSKKS